VGIGHSLPSQSVRVLVINSEEVTLNWNTWIRQTHRWLSIAFTLTVIANFAAMTQGQPPAWVTYSPLLPLALLMFTGLYLFVLPYVTRWRSGRRTGMRGTLSTGTP
jgi:hypothetical protein